jgi:hypothetical protein
MMILNLVAVAGHAQDASRTVSAGDRLPRVRSTNPVIAALLEEATEASATFRGLVELIDASDGLVYIFPGHCRRLAHACLTLSVTVAGPHRILQVLVHTGRNSIDVRASIGHELQHAIEVLGQPNLATGADLFFFYDAARRTIRGATLRGAVFETDAAIRAEDAVRAELQAAQASRRAKRVTTREYVAVHGPLRCGAGDPAEEGTC